MKKSFFPVLIAAVALLFSSCIKNVESDGVKAVRTGQAALLTAQAAAETTRATSEAALKAAEAALLTAQASVQTAMAAQTTANIAVTAEQTRHDAAVNKIKEEIAAAASTVRKAELVNDLAEENATSANRLLELAVEKAAQESAIALAKITAETSLATAQLALDKAKLDNARALLEAQKENEELLAKLKASNLGALAADYATAYANYTTTQADINENKILLIGLQAQLVIAKKDIVDSTDVKTQRAAVATAITDLAKAKTAVATATQNDDAAKGIVAALKLAVDGTPLNTLLAANQVKLDAEKLIWAGLKSELLQKEAQISDADFVMAYNASVSALANAVIAKNAAAQDTLAPAADVIVKTAAVNAAKADTVLKSTAFYTTLSYEHLQAGASFPTPKFVAYVNAKTAELTEQVGGAWITAADANDYLAAVDFYDASLLALTTSRTALNTAKTALTTATTALATAKTALTPTITALTAATAAKKVQQDKMDLLTGERTVINGKLTASTGRIAGYETFKIQLDTWIAGDPLTISKADALAAAELDQSNGVDGTKELLDAAKADEASATTLLAFEQGFLKAVIALYTTDLPIAQNDVVWLETRIADLTSEIANQTAILAQQKGVVDMWLEKIRLALA